MNQSYVENCKDELVSISTVSHIFGGTIQWKKILVKYTLNFFEQGSGINTYYKHALYFKNKGFQINLLGIKNFTNNNEWDRNKILSKNISNDLFVFDFYDQNKEEKKETFAEINKNKRKNVFLIELKENFKIFKIYFSKYNLLVGAPEEVHSPKKK